MALAVATLTACEKYSLPSEEQPNTEQPSDARTKKFTFTLKGDFSNEWKQTRGYLAADGKDFTDVWVLDYDAEGNLLPDAHRMTRYGEILRSTSLDELPELVAFADCLEAACIQTLNDGVMTKDLALLAETDQPIVTVTSAQFIAAIRKNLEKSYLA